MNVHLNGIKVFDAMETVTGSRLMNGQCIRQIYRITMKEVEEQQPIDSFSINDTSRIVSTTSEECPARIGYIRCSEIINICQAKKRNELVHDEITTVNTHMVENGSTDAGDLTRTNVLTESHSSPQSKKTTGLQLTKDLDENFSDDTGVGGCKLGGHTNVLEYGDGIDVSLRRSVRLRNKKKINYLDGNNDRGGDDEQVKPKLKAAVNNQDIKSKDNKESHGKSATEKHHLETKHQIDWKNARSIWSDNNPHKLLIKESLLIKAYEPELNRTTHSVPLFIYPNGIERRLLPPFDS